jgi:fucose 4-O-acetylase-like acetyltransferase
VPQQLRNHLYDNAKSAAIFMVVLGPLLEPLIAVHSSIKVLYMAIYSVHMPIFIIISGMFASNKLNTLNLKKIVKSTLIPFVAFTILYELFHLIIFKRFTGYTSELQPYWILWFLFSLFFWKLFLPVILRFRFPISLSILLAIIAGYFENIGYFLGLSRTIYFFPFFIIGYRLKDTIFSLEKLSQYPKQIFVLIIIVNFSLFYALSDIQHQWLYGSWSFYRLGDETAMAGLIRLAFYGISFCSAIALLMLLPKTKWKFTYLGNRSLFVYVWHGFIIKVLVGIGLIKLIGEYASGYALIALLLIAVAITLLLSMNFISKLTQLLILAPMTKVLGKND